MFTQHRKRNIGHKGKKVDLIQERKLSDMIKLKGCDSLSNLDDDKGERERETFSRVKSEEKERKTEKRGKEERAKKRNRKY